MGQRLLMIGVGMAGVAYLEAAGRLGHSVHVVELGERIPNYSGLISGATVTRGSLDEHWFEAALLAWRDHGAFDAVIGFNDPHVPAASLLACQYGLRNAGLPATMASRNKGLQRALFAAGGVPQPDFDIVDDPATAADWVRSHGPSVLKPISSFGSRGVTRVAGPQDVGSCGPDRMIVESEVTQLAEYSWEAVLLDGQVLCENITCKRTTGPPLYVETSHVVGGDLTGGTSARIREVATAAVKAMSVRTSIVHVEVFANDAEAVVVEVATRVPGDAIMRLLELSYGVDWHEVVIEACLGRRHAALPLSRRRAAGSFLAPTEGGRVVGVSGVCEALERSDVDSLHVFANVGDVLPRTTWSMERTLMAVVVGPDGDSVQNSIDWLGAHVRVQVDRPS